jgi:pimeloyl-ACP methyl ester carboxylesterase
MSGVRRSEYDVRVRRVPWQTTYARVSTVGSEGSRAFVLVPGIGVSSNYFERLAAQPNDFGPVHALDLPGFGGVPHPKKERMTIPQYADLVGTVVDELELNDPVLVGHSMGTQVVADLASRYPDRLDGSGRADTEPLSSIILLGPVLAPNDRSLGPAGRRFLQAARNEPPRVALLAIQAYLLCGVRWFSRVLPEMMHYPIEETLPKVRSNTLVISGQLDTLCPAGWVEEVESLLPVQHVRNPGTDPLPDVPPESTEEGETEDGPTRTGRADRPGHRAGRHPDRRRRQDRRGQVRPGRSDREGYRRGGIGRLTASRTSARGCPPTPAA